MDNDQTTTPGKDLGKYALYNYNLPRQGCIASVAMEQLTRAIDDSKLVVRNFNSLEARVFINSDAHSDIGLYSCCRHQLNESLIGAPEARHVSSWTNRCSICSIFLQLIVEDQP